MDESTSEHTPSPAHKPCDCSKALKYYFQFPHFKLTVLAPPKCGQTTMQWLKKDHQGACTLQTPGDVRRQRNFPVLAVIRNPVDRFWSLYQNKVLDQSAPVRTKGVPEWQHLGYRPTPAQALEWIADHPYQNIHWIPQACFDYTLATWVVRLEDLSEVWNRDKSLPQLPHKNKSHFKADRDPVVSAAVAELYAEDMEIWERAKTPPSLREIPQLGNS